MGGQSDRLRRSFNDTCSAPAPVYRPVKKKSGYVPVARRGGGGRNVVGVVNLSCIIGHDPDTQGALSRHGQA